MVFRCVLMCIPGDCRRSTSRRDTGEDQGGPKAAKLDESDVGKVENVK
jgi:hypothetical protein